MNPLAQLKKAIPVFLVALVCFGLSPVAQALLPPPPPDGGYPGQNTAEGEDALLSLTTGTDNTALGFQALYSNKVGFRNTATGANALFGSHGDGNANAINTAIWYLNNNVQICSADGPTLPSGWFLFEVGDFNGDGKPDYVLKNFPTYQTALWYLNNNVRVGSAYGPTFPSGWDVFEVGDFNGDNKPDYVLMPVN
jgi:hypothetical protein